MSKLAESLRALKIYNTWDLLRTFADKGKDVACSYSADGYGARCRGVHVFSR
jgi:hypothetical protein